MTESTLRSVPGLEPLAEKFTKTLQGVTVSAGAKQAASQSPKADAKSAPKSAEVKPVAEKPAATKPAPPGVQMQLPAKPPSKSVEGFQMEEVKGGRSPVSPDSVLVSRGFSVAYRAPDARLATRIAEMSHRVQVVVRKESVLRSLSRRRRRLSWVNHRSWRRRPPNQGRFCHVSSSW